MENTSNIEVTVALPTWENKNIIWSIRRSEFIWGESPSTYIIMKLGSMLSKFIPKVVVCVAESGKKNHEKYGYEPDNMIVIPNGFDVDKFNEKILKILSENGKFYFSDNVFNIELR